MKKKVYILMAGLMAVSSLGLTSCSDFLDEDNKTGFQLFLPPRLVW